MHIHKLELSLLLEFLICNNGLDAHVALCNAKRLVSSSDNIGFKAKLDQGWGGGVEEKGTSWVLVQQWYHEIGNINSRAGVNYFVIVIESN